MKCPRCGFFDPYWLPGYNSRGHLEYAHLSDVPEAKDWPIGEVIFKDGFAYWRSKKYAQRKPIELYKVEGKSKNPTPGYWDATNFDRGHHRKANTKLNEFSNAKVITYQSE